MEDLQQRVYDLEQELADNYAKLEMAGKIGKQLLENMDEINGQMEKAALESATKIEALTQEKYSLQLKIDQQHKEGSNFQDEIEALRISLQREKEKHELFVQTEHKHEIHSLKKTICSLYSELDKCKLTDCQKDKKLSELKANLTELQEQLNQKVNLMNETSSEEFAQLHTSLNCLQLEKKSLESELSDAKQDIQQKILQIEMLQKKLMGKDEEIENVQCQSTSYHNALEKSREEIQELRVQLDLIKMETQDQKQRGNSLFGELEDRRIYAEKKLISTKVNYESLQEQHQIVKKQFYSLKMQMATLLCMSSGRADENYVKALNRQLNQCMGDVRILQEKLYKCEKEKSQLESLVQNVNKQSNDSYVDLLLMLLKKSEKEMAEVKGELQTKQLLLMSETDKVIQSDQKIYSLERRVERLEAINIKLKLKVEELQLKYEPDKCKVKGKSRKGKLEKIPVISENKEVPQDVPKEKMDESIAEEGKDLHGVQKVASSEYNNAADLPTMPGDALSKATDHQSKAGDPQLKAEDPQLKAIDLQILTAVDENKDVTEKISTCMEHSKNEPRIMKSMKVKKVTMSDHTDIIEPIEVKNTECNGSVNDSSETLYAQKMEKPRGRQRYQSPVKVSSLKVRDECKTQ